MIVVTHAEADAIIEASSGWVFGKGVELAFPSDRIKYGAWGPPTEFVEACQPCETCGGDGEVWPESEWHDTPGAKPCPDCHDGRRRCELVVREGTPDEWCKALGVKILDPDGWDRSNFTESWSKVIDRHEFMQRMGRSTVTIKQPNQLPDGITVATVVAVGEPLRVVNAWKDFDPSGATAVKFSDKPGDLIVLDKRFAPADPQTLVGQWALQIEVVEP